MINEKIVQKLRCPIDGQLLSLSKDRHFLVNQEGTRRYPIKDEIAMLLAEDAEEINPLDL